MDGRQVGNIVAALMGDGQNQIQGGNPPPGNNRNRRNNGGRGSGRRSQGRKTKTPAQRAQTRFQALAAAGQQQGLFQKGEATHWTFRVGTWAHPRPDSAIQPNFQALRRNMVASYWSANRLSKYSALGGVGPDGNPIPAPEQLDAAIILQIRTQLQESHDNGGMVVPVDQVLPADLDLGALLAQAPPMAAPENEEVAAVRAQQQRLEQMLENLMVGNRLPPGGAGAANEAAQHRAHALFAAEQARQLAEAEAARAQVAQELAEREAREFHEAREEVAELQQRAQEVLEEGAANAAPLANAERLALQAMQELNRQEAQQAIGEFELFVQRNLNPEAQALRAAMDAMTQEQRQNSEFEAALQRANEALREASAEQAAALRIGLRPP